MGSSSVRTLDVCLQVVLGAIFIVYLVLQFQKVLYSYNHPDTKVMLKPDEELYFPRITICPSDPEPYAFESPPQCLYDGKHSGLQPKTLTAKAESVDLELAAYMKKFNCFVCNSDPTVTEVQNSMSQVMVQLNDTQRAYDSYLMSYTDKDHKPSIHPNGWYRVYKGEGVIHSLTKTVNDKLDGTKKPEISLTQRPVKCEFVTMGEKCDHLAIIKLIYKTKDVTHHVEFVAFDYLYMLAVYGGGLTVVKLLYTMFFWMGKQALGAPSGEEAELLGRKKEDGPVFRDPQTGNSL